MMSTEHSRQPNQPDPGLDRVSLRNDVERHYGLTLGNDNDRLLRDPLYEALALAIRDRLVARWKKTRLEQRRSRGKRVLYLSMEFLMGRALTNAIHALSVDGTVPEFLLQYGTDLETLAEAEHDAGLGNGGLGRLAACFLDSCATMALPVTGYGIRYEYGMFQQRIENGQQVEYPDQWLRNGNPWELERIDDARRVKFGGHTTLQKNADGQFSVHWQDTQDVLAIPYDVPIPGYRNDIVNTLRLWKAAATDEFNLEEFNAGSYTEAVEAKNLAENITMVLYPNDVSENGKVLRLRQQYFLASASLQDVVAAWVRQEGPEFHHFAEHHAFQLNDTHPSCAVAELMRIFLDDYNLGWDESWRITSACMAYTNHTLLPEALEKWSVELYRQLLPRLLEIIFEINARFLTEVASRWPGDVERLRRMSLIEEGEKQQIRMAYLAIVGSFSVNGVAALHSRLLCEDLFKDFYALWPHKFNNKTNGVTPRRWLQLANPGLAELITQQIGDRWQQDLECLNDLKPYAADSAFQQAWADVKMANKVKLSEMVVQRTGVILEPSWLMDVQVKRIHEYKRQLLKVLHIIHLYDLIHRGEGNDLQPRSVIIGGKAAPGYHQAKRIIHFINCVAEVVNKDPRASQQLRVVFLPDYGVTEMEIICPATELSEQISTAGKEASGTGNMKFMMNGALTIGTQDGANIEISEKAGIDNFFAFGLDAAQVLETGTDYDPQTIIESDTDLQRVLSLIESDHFCLFAPEGFASIADSVRSATDPWMLAADFREYIDTQRRVEQTHRDGSTWQRMSILNTASSGWFSSDRTISEYASDIWQIRPVNTNS
jgi:glycogen phosphorylase